MDDGLRIGVSSCFFHADPERAIFKGKTLSYVEESMLQYVMRHGEKAYLIPRSFSTVSLESYVDDFDGLLLQGGSDMSPMSYGESPIKPEWEGDRPRDEYEMELIQLFKKKNKPVFGICRGAQVINVTFGGSLFQDLVEQGVTKVIHRNWEIYDENHHKIEIKNDTLLSEIYEGHSERTVNSVHHQGLNKIAKNFRVSAVSESDGVIEAIEHKGDEFILAVQWHPEFQQLKRPDWLSPEPLMERFLNECRERRN